MEPIRIDWEKGTILPVCWVFANIIAYYIF